MEVTDLFDRHPAPRKRIDPVPGEQGLAVATHVPPKPTQQAKQAFHRWGWPLFDLTAGFETQMIIFDDLRACIPLDMLS